MTARNQSTNQSCQITQRAHILAIVIFGTMTIEQYQQEVDKWISTVGVRYFNELTNMAILTEEVGEVSRLIARIYGEQSFKHKEDEEVAKEKLADELADVLWVVTCIANQTGVDLTHAIQKNMDKKTNRDIDRHKDNPKLKT